MSLDDLERRLEQYESRLRAARLLLAQQKHRRAETPEETLALAAKLLQAVTEADALVEQLNSGLQDESAKRTQAIRARQQAALEGDTAGLSRLPQAGWERKTNPDPPDFGSRKLYGGDDDEAAGNAPVPTYPRRPVPVLAGGAARRFEESDEPPRSP
jgi:exonuclease VII large subunit